MNKCHCGNIIDDNKIACNKYYKLLPKTIISQ